MKDGLIEGEEVGSLLRTVGGISGWPQKGMVCTALMGPISLNLLPKMDLLQTTS